MDESPKAPLEERTLRPRTGLRSLRAAQACTEPSGFPAAPVLTSSPGWRLQQGWSRLPEREGEADPVPLGEAGARGRCGAFLLLPWGP